MKPSAAIGLVSFVVMIKTVIVCSSKYMVVLDRLRASYPWLVLNSTEDFVNRDPQ